MIGPFKPLLAVNRYWLKRGSTLQAQYCAVYHAHEATDYDYECNCTSACTLT